MKYKINVGDFTVDETVYHDRCLSASIGGGGVDSDVIPWEGTEYNPWDYQHDDGAFTLDPIYIPPTPQYDELEDAVAALNMLGVNVNG